MKRQAPRKLYRFIITDTATGKQEKIENILFTFRHDSELEIFTQVGDNDGLFFGEVLTYNAGAVTIRKA